MARSQKAAVEEPRCPAVRVIGTLAFRCTMSPNHAGFSHQCYGDSGEVSSTSDVSPGPFMVTWPVAFGEQARRRNAAERQEANR